MFKVRWNEDGLWEVLDGESIFSRHDDLVGAENSLVKWVREAREAVVDCQEQLDHAVEHQGNLEIALTTVRALKAGKAVGKEPEAGVPVRVSIFNAGDGHTYWKDSDGHWIGAPTYVDGTVDEENAGHVIDFYLTPEQFQALKAKLDQALTRGEERIEFTASHEREEGDHA